MNILELRIENIKNLKVVQIKPDGAVILEGINGAGKSAVIDSIFMALTGKKIEQPIRNGEKRAEIQVNLGQYRIKRIYTEKGDRLEVTNAEGAVFTSPQTMLNKIIGDLSFDPLSFAEKGRTTAGIREQRNILAALVGIDFTEMNKERSRLYDERTIKNREIKGGDPTSYKPSPNAPLPLEALVGSMDKPEDGTPRVEISMEGEIQKVTDLENAAEHHREYERRIEQMNSVKSTIDRDIEEATREIEEMEETIRTLQQTIGQRNEDIAKSNAEKEKLANDIAAIPEPAPVKPEWIDEARKGLLQVEEKNKKIRAAIEYDQKLVQLEEARKAVAKLEDAITKIDLEKERRVKEAQFPIAGLSITDEYIVYNGKPFGQLSTGEQIRISAAVAMALNPTLTVILIREGSLLDTAGLESIVALAQEKDYQLWIERVADKKTVGIFIEEGEIKDEQAKQPHEC